MMFFLELIRNNFCIWQMHYLIDQCLFQAVCKTFLVKLWCCYTQKDFKIQQLIWKLDVIFVT